MSALAYCQKNGMMHRDIKPENFLVKDPSDSQSTPNISETSSAPWTQRVLKLIDFGSARDLNESHSGGAFTDYVGTRWYRAPELILGSKLYDSSIDVFAVGCIMAELYLGRPIFPGQNAQDQLMKIVSVLGTPTREDWPQGHRLSEQSGMKFPQMNPTPISSLIKNRECSHDALDLMHSLLNWDSKKRVSA